MSVDHDVREAAAEWARLQYELDSVTEKLLDLNTRKKQLERSMDDHHNTLIAIHRITYYETDHGVVLVDNTSNVKVQTVKCVRATSDSLRQTGTIQVPPNPVTQNVPHTNSGHGHAWERPDGSKARCGGPPFCADCKSDAEHLAGSTA